MGRYFLKRLWHGIVVILGVTVLVFVVTRLVGSVRSCCLSKPRPSSGRSLRQLGLDRPIAVQFMDFLDGLTRLDFAIPLAAPAVCRSFSKNCR
jgi:peptide/nickel transport system permease protein